jgi:hypothetical protein
MELIVIASTLVILVASSGYAGHGIDWETYSAAADGHFVIDDGIAYYYAYWLLPLFGLYSLAGSAVGGLLWAGTNVLGAWFAARVFGARPAVVLAGFGALSAFYTGTITGIALAALAGLWWAIHARRWVLAGLLALVAASKPQWGVPLVAVIALQARPSFVAWLRMAALPFVAAGLSLLAHGWWPLDVIERASDNAPAGNGSLWHFLGPVTLLLWLPLALPMSSHRRLSVAAAASMLAVPYVQQYDQMVLWVMAADGVGLLSYLLVPLESLVGDERARAVGTLLPLGVYVGLVAEPVRNLAAVVVGRISSLAGHGEPVG